MSRDTDQELNRLRSMLGLPEPEVSLPTPFARTVASALTNALADLRAKEMIEVEDANVEALATEVINVALESVSQRKLPLRIVKTLIHSELVEEVYGTDEELSAVLRPFLDEI